MIASVVLAVAALRAGLAIRRAREAKCAPRPGSRQRHLRLAKPAVVLVAIGFVAGPVSAVWLRGWESFATFHSAVGVLVVMLFGAAAVYGYRLARGEQRARQLHALFGGLAVLASLLAAVAGFVLLP